MLILLLISQVFILTFEQKGSMLDLYVSSFCLIQTVKSEDIVTLISGFTVSSLPAYYSGNAGEVSGHIKLLGCVLSKAQPCEV